MKKILFGLVALLLILIGGSFAWYKVTYGGATYYVQIKEDGKAKEEVLSNGEHIKRYDYSLEAFDTNGNEKTIKFDADHNLRHEAYLKLTYNKVKGVTNWEEVQKNKVPTKALKHLE